ncbi:MAG: CDP-alcohol phosphatidyltransferase family protein [Burkholderiales bacterium]
MANTITTLRLVLLFATVWIAYRASPAWQLAVAPVLILIFVLDALDGWIARNFHEESLFGSIYDIAADRIVESVLWIVLADMGLVPLWITLVFITRGILVDAVRSVGASRGRNPFELGTSGIGRFLVGSRLMRGAYGVTKALTFVWIFLLRPWPVLAPERWAQWQSQLEFVTAVLVHLAVLMCIARALPVLLEFGPGDGRLIGLRPRRERP